MSQELVTASTAELEAIQAAQNSELEDDGAGSFSIPILKVAQSLTKEVQAGDAEPGEFIDSLTGTVLGDKIGFVIAFYQKGRFARDASENRAYTTFEKAIPQTWADLPLPGPGKQTIESAGFIGTPFDEFPDAEEMYRDRVNSGEIEWDRGPLVSTTHNYTGFALVDPLEGEEDFLIVPGRLSLKRSDVRTFVRPVNQILKLSLRGRPSWDKVFDLYTEKAQSKYGNYNLKAKLGRDTTPAEKLRAQELAVFVMQGRVGDNAEQVEGAGDVDTSAEGALSV